jgi:hypothetical protein
MGHHLSLVSVCPCIQVFFSGQTLVEAYCDILEERGAEADWYNRARRHLERWERCNSVNGTTVSGFGGLVRDRDWSVVLDGKKPLGSVGRNASKRALLEYISPALYPMAAVPGLREVFLHRITYILEKRPVSQDS